MIQGAWKHRFFLFAIAVAWFLPSLPHEFLNWDDEAYVVGNPWVQNFTADRLLLPFRHFHLSAWTPLPLLIYTLEFQLFGNNPAPYRLMNILLHGLTCVAVMELLKTMGTRRSVAFFFSLFFAIHPLRLESVVWISELKGGLCNLFFISGLLLWRRAGSSHRRCAATLLLFVLALLSKPLAVSFPVVLLVHDFLLCRGDMKKRLPWIVFMGLLAAGASLVNMKAQVLAIGGEMSFPERIFLALYSPLHHAMRTLVPVRISPVYPRELVPTRNPACVVAGVMTGISLGLTAVAFYKRRPPLSFGLLAAAIVLTPVSGLVPFSTVWAADRFSYLPTIMLFCGLAPLASRWTEHAGPVARKTAPVLGCLLIALHALATQTLIPVWQNSATFWQRVVHLYPESSKSSERLFATLIESGLLDPNEVRDTSVAGEAAAFLAAEKGHDEEAAKTYASLRNPYRALPSLMKAHRRLENRDEAVEAAGRLLELNPKAPAASLGDAAEILAWAGEEKRALAIVDKLGQPTWGGARALGLLAANALTRDKRDTARQHASRALRMIPTDRDALLTLGRDAMATGERSEAKRAFNKALRHPSAGTDVQILSAGFLARFAHEDKQDSAANEFLNQAFPSNRMEGWTAQDFEYAAFIAEEIGQGKRAARLYRRALDLEPDRKTPLINLAGLHLSRGETESALKLLRQAAELWPEDVAIQANLELAASKSDAEKDKEMPGDSSPGKTRNPAENLNDF